MVIHEGFVIVQWGFSFARTFETSSLSTDSNAKHGSYFVQDILSTRSYNREPRRDRLKHILGTNMFDNSSHPLLATTAIWKTNTCFYGRSGPAPNRFHFLHNQVSDVCSDGMPLLIDHAEPVPCRAHPICRPKSVCSVIGCSLL